MIAVVVTSVKFIDGAWLVLLLIPTLVGVMLFIRREYDAQTGRAGGPAPTSCSTSRTASSGS